MLGKTSELSIWRFSTSKVLNGLQNFGNFRQFLYLIKLSFLNLCVTEFRLAALHLTSLADTEGGSILWIWLLLF